MNELTSRVSERVKQLVRLCDRKEHIASGLFRFEGAKLLKEYLDAGLSPRAVYVAADALEKYAELVKRVPEDRLCLVSDSVYDKITSDSAPDGVLCVSDLLPNVASDEYAGGGVMLESVRDNGNVGTVLRSALAFGADAVYVSADCADVYAQKTVRSSMGAVFRQRIVVCTDPENMVREHIARAGVCWAAMPSGGAAVLGRDGISRSDLVVIGNEGHGISAGVASLCRALSIPTDERSESLNAAVAASVILWEAAAHG